MTGIPQGFEDSRVERLRVAFGDLSGQDDEDEQQHAGAKTYEQPRELAVLQMTKAESREKPPVVRVGQSRRRCFL